MDSTIPRPQVSQESARESLIAISQSIPENTFTVQDSTPVKSPETNGLGLKEPVGSGTDDFRSMLISISYAPSPDAQPLPEAQPLAPTLGNPAT